MCPRSTETCGYSHEEHIFVVDGVMAGENLSDLYSI